MKKKTECCTSFRNYSVNCIKAGMWDDLSKPNILQV